MKAPFKFILLVALLFLSNKNGFACTAPTITSNPFNAVVCVGNDTSFAINATGPSLSYQWQVDQGAGFINLTNVLPYSGVFTNVLNLTGVSIGLNNYIYRCIVSNGCPPDATSGVGTLKVNSVGSIVGQPVNAIICEGSSGSFSVITSGSGLTYQWQVDTGSGFNNVPSVLPYSGDTTGTLYITNPLAGMNGYIYHCIVSAYCSLPITSSSGILTVNLSPSITAQPNFVTVCEGTPITIPITAVGTGIAYQWQLNTGSGYSNIIPSATYSGVTSNTLSISTASTSMNGYLYRCVVSGTCTPSTLSYEIPLIVHPVYNTNAALTICQGTGYLFGTTLLTAPGFYTHLFTSVNGCDSMVSLSLSVSAAYYTTISTVICAGDSVLINGTYETVAAVYTFILPTIAGCDSTIENTMSLLPSFQFNNAVTICQGDSALIFGTYQNTAGNYFDSYSTVLGCDSIYTTILIVNPVYTTTLNLGVCSGDSILISGVYQSTAGSYPNLYSSIAGCDSMVTSILTIYPNYALNDSVDICIGDSIFLQGAFQTAAGIYVDSLNSFTGCDSIVTTVLKVNLPPAVGFVLVSSVCDTASTFALTGGSPAGGTYSGPGVVGTTFSPSLAGVGIHTLTYTYIDSIGCVGIKTADIAVTTCVGVNEYFNDIGFAVFPNPASNYVNVILNQTQSSRLRIYSVIGLLVFDLELTKERTQIDIHELPSGVYFVELSGLNFKEIKKISKQ